MMLAAYTAGAGGLALRRHWNLESQALDMGYADQIAWNLLHGRWFRFTVFRGQVGSEFGQVLQYGPGADRDSLFAYHVELAYLPLALLYLIYPGPETLIVVLTAVLALGALPVYWIAHRHLAHRGAALAFAAMYLLFPSVQAANLSDFHPVSMTAALLMLAVHWLLARRYRAFLVAATACAATKEEVGLLVGMMGLYAWLVRRQRPLGLAVAGLSFGWVAFCFGVIIPHFTGGAPSLFTVRYAAAIGQLRDFPHALLAGRFASPVPSFAVAYVAHLLASTGFLALLGPRQLALAAPALAINGLSSSTWQHGGGAHYSSEAVPGLIFAAVAGTRWLAAQCWRWLKVPPASAALAIALLGLGIALVESRTQGLLPPAQRFTWPAPSAHAARLRPLLDLIPPGAPVSAQSNVYPHLSTREQIYVFPTVDDAEYVLVDVAGASDPLRPGDLYPAVAALLASPRFELLAGDDGFLVFGRVPHGAAAGPPAAPPPAFYSFVHAPEGEPSTPVQASFEGRFDVVGYRVEWPPAVGFSVRRATPVVYFRPRAPMDHAYRLSVFLIGRDGQVRLVDDGSAAEQWYPTHRWRMSERGGEVIRVRFPPVSYLPGTRLGIGARAGPGAAASRLRVTGPHARVRDGGRVVEVGPLP